MQEITSEAELRELIGEPHPRDAGKVRHRLDALDREWLAAAPFCLIATSDGSGACDVSPKGDPAGIALVLDDRTLAIPERPGNRRGDGFRNILANPHVGLIFLVPGRGDTLRVNGRARLLRDADFFDRMTVKGHRPQVVVLVEVDEVFSHCSKSFLRSALWKPDSWRPDAAPSRARMAAGQERRGQSVEELEVYYGPGYASKLYG